MMRKAQIVALIAVLVIATFGCRKNKGSSNESAPFGFAVVIEKNGIPELWYMGEDGESFNKVYNESIGIADVEGNPAWSSDGRKIYFTRNSDQPAVNGIYRVKPDGTELTPVYIDNDTQTRKFYHVATSNDDQHIIFSYDIPRNGRKVVELYRMCPCGKQVNRLSNFELDKDQAGNYANTVAYAGSFSRDDNRLLLCQADPSVAGKKNVRIMSMEINNPDSIKLITTIRANDVEGCTPGLSPDGEKILLSIDSYLYSMNADGTNLKQLGQLRGFRPVWDKNSSDFYFSSYNIPDMQQGIYKANIQLTKVEMVSRRPGAGTYCGFSINK